MRRQYLAIKRKSPQMRKSSGFRNLLWEFKFTEIESKTSQIMRDNGINPLYKEGFENFRAGLEEFLTENGVAIDENLGHFKMYSSVSVESTDIIRTSGSFYGNEWFSDVAVSSEETMWYGKVIFNLYHHKLNSTFHMLYNVIYLIFRRFYCWNFLRKI